MYVLYRCSATIIPRLPSGLRRGIAALIGTLAWVLARQRRRHVSANVSQVLGFSGPPSSAERWRTQSTVRRIFHSCFRNYIELLAISVMTREQVAAQLDVRGAEHLEQALALGRGAILFSAHLGPFEYLPAWFSAHGYQMSIPVEKLSDARMLRLVVDLRRHNGAEFIPLDGLGSVRRLFESLRKNQIVLITADRTVVGGSVLVDFFGAAAALPRGPVDLAVRTGAPLVGAFGWRTAKDRMAAEFIPLTLAVPAGERLNPDVLQKALTHELEQMISQHLDQWVVFEPIWKDRLDQS